MAAVYHIIKGEHDSAYQGGGISNQHDLFRSLG